MTDQNESLGEDLPREMARVRDEVMPLYYLVGIAGVPALMMMRHALNGAAKAMAEGDVVAMTRWYQELKGFRA